MKTEKIGGRVCPIEENVKIFGGKWKASILFHLSEGQCRFNELKRRIPAITQRMLTIQLRELERDGLVIREQFNEIPPRVEPQQRAHSPWLAAGLASESKLDRIPYGRRFPAACGGELQYRSVESLRSFFFYQRMATSTIITTAVKWDQYDPANQRIQKKCECLLKSMDMSNTELL